ncbi:ATP-dependent helicase [Pectobacterium punjabense]|uniref:DNA 3'-5' helicase n=1 Tax=Pectobacterium punjabense TaxID=2108399 RepID=A0ABX6KY05_9GAMM|nr:ATP-dependent helicase [Pectobacterium punjabense]MBS4432798.1 ATP-dependent helicase [Pectobacterium punjabense]PTA63308.1 ATP-dependent helicase [Pectobacterium punjabense]QJA18975.1 ATP-dependent helicase [Pectobacterium punjabense]
MFTWNKGDLNQEQEDAILAPESVFLIACPGSGKTRTLTYKIAYELSRLKSNKQFVVAITYTHRAADEIHERIEDLGVDTSQLWIGTIHSFCLEWILKPYGIYHEALDRGFRVIDQHERQEILDDLCKPYLKLKPKITFWDCDFYFIEAGYILLCPQVNKHNGLNKILNKYFEILRESRKIDFELILFYSYQLITHHPEISSLLGQLFPIVLVDEYQDTKQIQYSIITAILKASRGATRAFIVGDPNQAIYQSLGGYPISFEDFKSMASIDIEELELSRNYRSSERIINYFGNFNAHATRIEAASDDKTYQSLISFDNAINKKNLESELIRLIRFNIETIGIAPHNVCVLAPQWTHLASMTRRLAASMPEYSFDGPGQVPFARDIENFWYKLSKIALTQASPGMYVRRLRWAGEVLGDLEAAGVNTAALTRSTFLRECNTIKIDEIDGLIYLHTFFEMLFTNLTINFRLFPQLQEHHTAFFKSSQSRIDRLRSEGSEFIGDIKTFRKVFQSKTGITISTIHGVKGTEFDTVIAYALLEDMVPHFNDPNGQESAMKLLYVISSRARKNLHLISERGRIHQYSGQEYQATLKLMACNFGYDKIP